MRQVPDSGFDTSSTTLREPGLIDVRGHFETLWSRRSLVALATLVGLALAGLYLVVTPPRYSALATVLVDPRQEQVTDATAVLPGIGADSAAITSQVNVLESRGLLERVFASEQLAEDDEFSSPGMLSRLLATLRGTEPTSSPEAAFDEFRRRVAVQRVGLTYVLEVRFTSGDPLKAARLANAIIDQFLRDLAGERSNANLGVTEQLGSRITALQDELSSAELAVEQFRSEHDIVANGAGTTVLQSQIDQLTAQISVARQAQREAENRSEQAQAALSAASGIDGMEDLLVSPVGAQLRSQFNAQATAIGRMQATMGDRHPSLVSAQAELMSLEALIREEAERTAAQLEADRRLAQDNVAQAEAELARLATRLGETNRDEVALRQLERDADVARNLLEEFMRRARETGELGTMQTSSNARVLSAAAEPRSATWPKASLTLGVAGAFGFMAGCALAFTLGRKLPRQFPATDPTPPAQDPTPVAPLPTTTRRPKRPPSFAQAGQLWRDLGPASVSDKAAVTSARVAAFIEEALGASSEPAWIGLSALTARQQRSELSLALARYYSGLRLRTLVLDFDPHNGVLTKQVDTLPMLALSEFDAKGGRKGWQSGGDTLVIVDDRPERSIPTQALLETLKRAAIGGDFDLVIVNAPSRDASAWHAALAPWLAAEVLILRAEETAGTSIEALSAQHPALHPIALLTVSAVPVLASAPAERSRRRPVREGAM